MPTPAKGPRLGGSAAHERLMLANLANSLFEHRAITTTEHRAKRLQPVAEKFITKAKRGDLHARRTVLAQLRRKDIVALLFEELAEKFDGRDGGYTRITKLPNRKGDNAPMALIELVLEPVKPKKKAAPKKAADAPATDAAPAEDTEATSIEVPLDETPEVDEAAMEEAAQASRSDETSTEIEAVDADDVSEAESGDEEKEVDEAAMEEAAEASRSDETSTEIEAVDADDVSETDSDDSENK